MLKVTFVEVFSRLFGLCLFRKPLFSDVDHCIRIYILFSAHTSLCLYFLL